MLLPKTEQGVKLPEPQIHHTRKLDGRKDDMVTIDRHDSGGTMANPSKRQTGQITELPLYIRIHMTTTLNQILLGEPLDMEESNHSK